MSIVGAVGDDELEMSPSTLLSDSERVPQERPGRCGVPQIVGGVRVPQPRSCVSDLRMS